MTADDFFDKDFGSDTPLMILAKLKQAYGEPIVEEMTGQMKRVINSFD